MVSIPGDGTIRRSGTRSAAVGLGLDVRHELVVVLLVTRQEI